MSNHPNQWTLWNSWLTVKLLVQEVPAYSEPAIRSLIFNAEDRQSSKGTIPGNGLAPYIRRIGSKVLINHGGFLLWIEEGGQHFRPKPSQENPTVHITPRNYSGRTAMALEGNAPKTKGQLPKSEPRATQPQEVALGSNSKQGGRRRL